MMRERRQIFQWRPWSNDGRSQLATNTLNVTQCPKGRNVVLASRFGAPRISKDGMSMVKEIELKD